MYVHRAECLVDKQSHVCGFHSKPYGGSNPSGPAIVYEGLPEGLLQDDIFSPSRRFVAVLLGSQLFLNDFSGKDW